MPEKAKTPPGGGSEKARNVEKAAPAALAVPADLVDELHAQFVGVLRAVAARIGAFREDLDGETEPEPAGRHALALQRIVNCTRSVGRLLVEARATRSFTVSSVSRTVREASKDAGGGASSPLAASPARPRGRSAPGKRSPAGARPGGPGKTKKGEPGRILDASGRDLEEALEGIMDLMEESGVPAETTGDRRGAGRPEGSGRRPAGEETARPDGRDGRDGRDGDARGAGPDPGDGSGGGAAGDAGAVVACSPGRPPGAPERPEARGDAGRTGSRMLAS